MLDIIRYRSEAPFKDKNELKKHESNMNRINQIFIK